MIECGWLPDPEEQHFWPDLHCLLDMAASYGGVPVIGPGHLVWIAIEGPEIIGAATTRLMTDGNTELLNVAGWRMREWVPQMEAMIAD